LVETTAWTGPDPDAVFRPLEYSLLWPDQASTAVDFYVAVEAFFAVTRSLANAVAVDSGGTPEAALSSARNYFQTSPPPELGACLRLEDAFKLTADSPGTATFRAIVKRYTGFPEDRMELLAALVAISTGILFRSVPDLGPDAELLIRRVRDDLGLP